MRTAFLTLSLLAGSGLLAQGVSMNGGLQVGLSLPTGDFADKEDISGNAMGVDGGAGIHFGGHLDFNFSPHHQLRLIANVNGFATSDRGDYYYDYFPGFYFDTNRNRFGVAQFGADYVFHVHSPFSGGYLLAGLNFNHVKAEYYSYSFLNTEITQSGRPGIRVGGGYTFNRIFSLEGHLNRVSVESSGPDGLGYDALTWVAVSAVFRFGRR